MIKTVKSKLIAVNPDIVNIIRSMKVHPRETDGDVVTRLVHHYEKECLVSSVSEEKVSVASNPSTS